MEILNAFYKEPYKKNLIGTEEQEGVNKLIKSIQTMEFIPWRQNLSQPVGTPMANGEERPLFISRRRPLAISSLVLEVIN